MITFNTKYGTIKLNYFSGRACSVNLNDDPEYLDITDCCFKLKTGEQMRIGVEKGTLFLYEITETTLAMGWDDAPI